MASRNAHEDAWINLRPYDPKREVSNWSSRHNDNRGQQNYGFERDSGNYNDLYYNRPYYIYGDSQRDKGPQNDKNTPRPKNRRAQEQTSQRHVAIQKSKPKSYARMAIVLLTIIAFILLSVLAVFLVLYIMSLQDNNLTTIAPTQPTVVTSQAPPAGVVTVGVSMKLMQSFLPEYNDVLSPGYRALESNFTNAMDEIFSMSNLRSSYDATNVNSFSPGSIDVNATITFNEAIITDVMVSATASTSGTTSSPSLSIETRIQMIVQDTIVTTVESGMCCQGLVINTTTVITTEVILPVVASTPQMITRMLSSSAQPTATVPVTMTTSAPEVTTRAPIPSTAAPSTAGPSTIPPQPDVTTAATNPSTAPPDPVFTTPEMQKSTTVQVESTTVAMTTPMKSTTVPVTTTPVESTTVAMTTTPVKSTTVPVTTIQMDSTTVPVTLTPAATTTIPSTTPAQSTTSSVDSPSTPEQSTTMQPGILNPAGCGVSTKSAPSTPATVRGTWPWLGSVKFRTGHACGCTLIGDQWAVTSSTCVGDGGTLESLVFGDITSSYSQSDVQVEHPIETVYVHPGYNRVTLDNAVAFLRLAQPVVVSNDIRPLCFQRDEQTGTPQNYQNCYIAGWGTLAGVLNENLMTSPVTSVTDGLCPGSVLPVNLTDKFICAQFTDTDACLGDSGAGLMCQDQLNNAWSLIGILDSTTDDCSMATFTKVASYWDIASSIIDGTSEFPCEPIQVPQCTAVLSYSSTYPTTQSVITAHMDMAESSGLLTCHSQASVVLCAALMPECQADGTGLTLCQQMCEEVSSACMALFNQLSVTLDCRSYPQSLDASSVLCQTEDDYSCGNRSLTLPAMYDYLTLSSPNYPNPYSGLEDCIWIITAPQDAYIIIKFLALNIESCCDTLTIGEGSDVENRTTIQAAVFGSNLPKPLVVASPSMWLRFQSDSADQVKGFQAEVQAVGTSGLASYCFQDSVSRCSDGVSCIPFRWRCDDIMDCPSGEDESCQTLYEQVSLGIDGSQQIRSPGYSQGSYIDLSNVTWIIHAQPGRKLLINFEDFKTEQDFDVFQVGDGLNPSDAASLFFFWSGLLMPPVILSEGNQMWIQFTSDLTTTRKGFDLTVFDVENSVTFDCESHQFDCGHLVCVPAVWQCNNIPNCADSSDETGCTQVMATGSMTLLTPFTSDLLNQNSSEYMTLSNQFTNAIDPVLSSSLGTAYVDTKVNNFRSSDDPTSRVTNPPDTVVDYTIELNRYPSTNQILSPSQTQALITDIITEEVSDGSLGSITVNSSSVQISHVTSGESPTTPETPNVCIGSEVQCDGSLCVSVGAFCNQIQDCTDGTDEELGVNCPVACGGSNIDVPSQGTVDLTGPMVTANNNPSFSQQCGYIITVPANHRVYLVILKISLVSGSQRLILSFGQGKTVEYTASVEQPLDIVSIDDSVRISLSGDHWSDGDGISFQFSATQVTDIAVCDNGVQVLPAGKRCDQHHDCLDYSDESNCNAVCGQSDYTLGYNTSLTLQLTNFPSNYYNNMACVWLFTGLTDAAIIFDVNIINIATPDSLSFGLGHDPGVRVSTVAEVPGILPTGSHILISGSLAYMRFISDSMTASGGFSVGVRVLYNEDFVLCNNLVQAVFRNELCDGVVQCVGVPSDEHNCDACQEIPISSCVGLLPYTTTEIPSKYASNISHAMTQYLESQDSFCQPMTEMVMCSLLFPECPVDGLSRRAVCRSVCEAALGNCSLAVSMCDSLPSTGGDVWCNYEGDVLETGICGTRPAVSSPFMRIVNGNNAALGNWPWILSILDDQSEHHCGATLINHQWAITAAHCMDIIVSASAGFTRITAAESGSVQNRTVTKIYNHPFYDAESNDNDITLIKLDSPIEFTDNIRPACLETNENEIIAYDNCYISGWGALSEHGGTSDRLQEARVPLINKTQCIKNLGDIFTITDNMICAGYQEGGIDSCQGDSGGPLVCEGPDGRWKLIGATSFGYGCARAGRPGVYARISQYIDFITFNIEEGNKM